jgi:hypothetical protein
MELGKGGAILGSCLVLMCALARRLLARADEVIE